MFRQSRIVAVVSLAVCVGACAKDVPIAELKGSCADVYKAQVCTWAKMRGDSVLEVGATVPIATIENSTVQAPMVWPPVAAAALDIPEAARQKSGLVQFTMYWEAGGHPPGPFLTPHFDMHFNRITAAARSAIDCVDVSKPVALPAGYALPDITLPPDMAKMMGVPTLVGLCVPQMGMHALVSSELASKETFRSSMVVGYSRAAPIFIEPMLTKAMLLEKKSFDLAVPSIPGLTGAHPTKFRADYDATKQEYRMTFSGFSTGL